MTVARTGALLGFLAVALGAITPVGGLLLLGGWLCLAAAFGLPGRGTCPPSTPRS